MKIVLDVLLMCKANVIIMLMIIVIMKYSIR